MARWSRRKSYGRRRRAFRGRRRRYGKRRSYRRLRSRRTVTRRVLQRALRPLRPEWKYYDMYNTQNQGIPQAQLGADVYSFCDGNDDLKTLEGTSTGRPQLITHNIFQGVTASERIGRKVQYRRIEIRYKILPNTTSQTPIRVRVFVLRTGDLPQFVTGFTNTTFTGSSWPSIYQDPVACCWIYDDANFDSFPSVLQAPRAKMVKIAAARRHVISPNYNTNSPAGTGYIMGNPGGSTVAYGRIVIKPKGPTWYNDSDTSLVNGWAQKGHYWLYMQADSGINSVLIPAGALKIRCWFTDP